MAVHQFVGHGHVGVALVPAGGGLEQQLAEGLFGGRLVEVADRWALPHPEDAQRGPAFVREPEGEVDGGGRGRAAVHADHDVGRGLGDVLGAAHDDDRAVGLGAHRDCHREGVQHLLRAAQAAGAEHDQLGVRGLPVQHQRRKVLIDGGDELQTGVPLAGCGGRPVQCLVAALAQGLVVAAVVERAELAEQGRHGVHQPQRQPAVVGLVGGPGGGHQASVERVDAEDDGTAGAVGTRGCHGSSSGPAPDPVSMLAVAQRSARGPTGPGARVRRSHPGRSRPAARVGPRGPGAPRQATAEWRADRNEEVATMTRIRVVTRPTRPHEPPPQDLRTPSGRPLPY
ncbi:hypothetical protein KAURM247S_00837 [Kitasatospora aureofaciens]